MGALKTFYQLIFSFSVLVGCSIPSAWASEPVPYSERQIYGKSIVDHRNLSCDELIEFYKNPPLMAIGDSLYNGVQAFRINWFLSEWSVPSLVAIRFGYISERYADRNGDRLFHGPQYPGHGDNKTEPLDYGFNLERIPYFPFLILQPRIMAQRLYDLAFKYTPPNGRVFVDNIAFSGASSRDLLSWTSADYRREAESSIRSLRASFGLSHLASAFTLSNAAFVLNPTRSHCVESMTPLDQVIVREPKVLLISIGANNGLYQMASEGLSVNDPPCLSSDARILSRKDGSARCAGDTIQQSLMRHYIADMSNIIDVIASKNIEKVLINGLIYPSQTANLVPQNSGEIKIDLFGVRTVSGKTVMGGDALVRSVNEQLSSLIDAANRRLGRKKFEFVNVAELMSSYDYKSCALTEQECVNRKFLIDGKRFGLGSSFSQYLDNRPLRASGPSEFLTGRDLFPKIEQGGLFSFDNLHLSSVGYEILADRISFLLARHIDQLPNRCSDDNNIRLQVGDCARLLSLPGWSFADATRRDVSFLRNVGLQQTDRLRRLNGFVQFVSRFGSF